MPNRGVPAQAAPGKSAEELIPYTDPGDISEAQHATSKLQRLAEALLGAAAAGDGPARGAPEASPPQDPLTVSRK